MKRYTGKKLLSEIFPNGASKKMQEDLHFGFFKEYGNPYTAERKPGQVPKDLWSKAIWRLEAELSAISMLDSCFAYGGTKRFYEEHPVWSCCGPESYYNQYLQQYLDEGGTREEYDRMIKIQEDYLNNRCAISYAGTDGEGNTYNGIREVAV